MSAQLCLAPDNASGDCVQLKHGFGSKAMNTLIEEVFAPYFVDVQFNTDSALLVLPDNALREPLAKTTDAHVIDPVFFPGGNIGTLAAAGTINDLLANGAIPFTLAVSIILTEGFRITDLHRIVASLAETSHSAGAKIVTGDTKVLPRNSGTGIMITTTGLGYYTKDRQPIVPTGIKVGDAIMVTGPLGQHFAAIYAVRSQSKYTSTVQSDVRSLHKEVDALISNGIGVHCLRDLTRGGLSAALVSMANDVAAKFRIDEASIPHHSASCQFCEITGYDLLSRANEGRMVVFLDPNDTSTAIDLLCKAGSPGAKVIGFVESVGGQSGEVLMKTTSSFVRRITMPDGADLNCIC